MNELGIHTELEEQAKIGVPVIWFDDVDCHGHIETIHPGNGNCATHCGNLYICRFQFRQPGDPDWEEWLDEDGNPQTYTRSFDSYSLGRGLKLVGQHAT